MTAVPWWKSRLRQVRLAFSSRKTNVKEGKISEEEKVQEMQDSEPVKTILKRSQSEPPLARSTFYSEDAPSTPLRLGCTRPLSDGLGNTGINYNRPWDGFSVILDTDHADGRRLYAQKAALAQESTYFHSLFFSGFNSRYKEERRKEFKIPVDYEALYLILQITHETDFDYSPEGNFYFDVDDLKGMYVAAERLKMPQIRNLCIDHLRSMAVREVADEEAAEAATAAVCLGLYDIFLEYNAQDGKKYTHRHMLYQISNRVKPCLSKADVPWLHDLLWPQSPFVHFRPERRVIQRLEDVVVEQKDRKWNLSKSWPGCDVGLRTWNSNGKIIYSNKQALSKLSPYFHNIFSEKNRSRHRKQAGNDYINVPVEYITMLQILHFLLDKAEGVDVFPTVHPVLLYDMHWSCGPTELNIPAMVNFCERFICESDQYDTMDALDVASKMGLHEDQIVIVENRAAREEEALHEWINGQKLIYMRNGKEVDITSSNTKKLLSLKAFFTVYPRM